MDRCHGTTKAGDRCKRSVPEGEEYCSIHVGQGSGPIGDTTEDVLTHEDTGLLDTLFVMAAAGLIITIGLVLRRSFRLL